jgi:hypothetical protein
MHAMLRGLALTLALVALVGCNAEAQDKKTEDKKGVVIEIDNLKSTAPASWKSEEPTNKMRYMQFKLPKVGDDKDDAELVMFKGLGGSADANIDRWKKTFVPPEGKKIDDVAKVTTVKVGKHEGVYLDVTGTYMFNPAPFNPASKAVPRENYRMLAIHFDGPENPYHIRLTGPAKTVESYKKGFDDWFNGLK